MSKQDDQQWGLKACGSYRRMSVELYECCSDQNLYDMDINTGAWSMRCRVDSPDVIQRILDFLYDSNEAAMAIGAIRGADVEIRRDAEFHDRFFFATEGVFCAVKGQDSIQDLINALIQAVEDL